MNQIGKFKVWSNVFFIFPLLYAIQHNIYWYTLIIGSTIVVSTLFHFYNEKKYFYSDCYISVILMVSNFTLLIIGDWLMPYSATALLSACVAIYFYYMQFRHNYNIKHGLWHFFSAVVCYYSILTFVR